MNDIFIWSPVLFGAVIGWLIVYFTRRLSDFTANSLLKVAVVSVGGTGFCSLTFFESTQTGSIVIMYYLLGIGIGFFTHWIYQICISVCLRKKFYNHRELYDALSGCNVRSKDDVDGFKLHRKAEKLIICFEQWNNGKISEEEMVNYFKESDISKSEFDSMIDENREELLLDDITLTTIKAKKMDQYFR